MHTKLNIGGITHTLSYKKEKRKKENIQACKLLNLGLYGDTSLNIKVFGLTLWKETSHPIIALMVVDKSIFSSYDCRLHMW